MTRRHVLIPVLVAALLVAGRPSPILADEASDLEAARALFREGARLGEEGAWAEARDRYERSLALKRSPITLYSLGVAQRQTGQLVRALASFRQFLDESATLSTRPYEPVAREAVTELEKRVSRVAVTVLPDAVPGLVVELDGAAVSQGAAGVLADPGAHVVTASAEGHAAARAEITSREGERTNVTLVLAPVVLAPAPAPTPAARPPPLVPVAPPRFDPRSRPPEAPSGGEPSTRGYVGWALIGGGGALLLGGVVVGLLGVQTASRASAQNDDVASAARAQSASGDVLAAVGLASAAAGAVLLLTEPPPAPRGSTSVARSRRPHR